MNDDAQSLQRYAEDGSEEAFRDLVDRHLPLVYSTALRILGGDPQLAQDVAQHVFADVARKARVLSHHPVLAGWLHRHTSFMACKTIRTERRRRAREQEACRMNASATPSPTTDPWQQVEPHLDQALDALGRTDRDAVVLRYLQRRDFRAVGQALGCSEDAAQKRVTRALEKLRHFFQRRGVTLSVAALSTVLGAHAAGAAPAGLAAIVSTGAITSAAAAGLGVMGTSMVTNWIQFMTTEKLTTVAVSTLLVAGLGTPLALQHQAKRNLETENQALRQQLESEGELRADSQSVAGLSMAPEEVERLRRENAELHRLRGEVALLRAQREENQRLAAENADLRRLTTEMAEKGVEQANRTYEEKAEMNHNIARLNYSKGWLLAIHLYAEEHDGQVPGELTDAASFFRPESGMMEGFSAEDLELVYAGTLGEIQAPARTFVMREREPQLAANGKWTRSYGFADGHTEIVSQPTEDFSNWEQDRMPSNAALPVGSQGFGGSNAAGVRGAVQ